MSCGRSSKVRERWFLGCCMAGSTSGWIFLGTKVNGKSRAELHFEAAAFADRALASVDRGAVLVPRERFSRSLAVRFQPERVWLWKDYAEISNFFFSLLTPPPPPPTSSLETYLCEVGSGSVRGLSRGVNSPIILVSFFSPLFGKGVWGLGAWLEGLGKQMLPRCVERCL